MNYVEDIEYQNNKIYKTKFKTLEGMYTEKLVNRYEPKLLKQIQDEVYKLQVEPGDFSFEYMNNSCYYEVIGTNKNHHQEIELLINDVTDKHCLKQKLNNYDALVLLGEMAGGLAHDLGNQMMVAINALELIEADINKSKNLKILKKTTKNASSLVQSLLAYLRNETSAKSPVNLNDLVQDTISFFKQIKGANVTIDFTKPADDMFIMGERKALLNAFLNILINAKDAMSGCGKISINIDLVNLAQLPENSAFNTEVKGTYYRLRITDNGSGISPENIKNIFLPFYTTKKNKGNGLGLANVALIVEEHHGVIACDSVLNEHTTFELYLPSINAYINPLVLVSSDNINFLTKMKELSKFYNYEFIYYAKQFGQAYYQKNYPIISYVITDYDFVFKHKTKILKTDQQNLKEKVSNFL